MNFKILILVIVVSSRLGLCAPKSYVEFNHTVPYEEPEIINLEIAVESDETEVTEPQSDFFGFPEMERIEIAEQRLQWFFGCLLSFIHEVHFDITEFEISAPTLRSHLNDIYEYIEEEVSEDALVWKSFEFVMNMFERMVAAAALIRFNDLNGSHYSLVRHMVRFNLRLITFFDAFGVPDTSIPDYRKMVYRLAETLEYWRSIFDFMKDVPFGVSALFENQFAEAKYTLQILALHYQNASRRRPKLEWPDLPGKVSPLFRAFAALWESGLIAKQNSYGE